MLYGVTCLEGVDMVRKKKLFKVAKRRAKKTIVEEKAKAYQDIYRRLNTKKGVNEVFKLVKTRNQRRRDLISIHHIKDEGDHVLLHDANIKARWGRYLCELLNTARWMNIILDPEDTQIIEVKACSQDITREKVRAVLCLMGKGKLVCMDDIPIEMWHYFADFSMRWFTNLFNVILRTTRMLNEWRLSVLVPLYKINLMLKVVVTTVALNYLVIQ
ncbi:uncharacterized protein LOC141679778 [Apium graveolens]|uniref:uncharacterized protein LOC141679778 n=1 Tax=Apium graveolens TaxID=4045 RepID=UPI003D7B4CDE